MPKKPPKGKTTPNNKIRDKNNEAGDGEDEQKATYAELVAEDPNFTIGNGKFDFPNGDRYEGEFFAHINGLIWRQGEGTYLTKEGQIYQGEWDGDKLLESKDVEITFPDGVKYIGNLVKSKYSGSGIYQINENVNLTCTFQDNKPIGEITLVDPNGKMWHGFCEKDECLLIQEHPFYRNIRTDLGKGRCKKKSENKVEKLAVETETAEEEEKEEIKKSDQELKFSDFRAIEQEIFAKSDKTQFGEDDTFTSAWYENYSKFSQTYTEIIEKILEKGENFLNSDEYEWYKKYKEFAKKYLTVIKERKFIKSPKKNAESFILAPNELFRYIHSDDFKILNKPVPVFYTRNDSDREECDFTCKCNK